MTRPTRYAVDIKRVAVSNGDIAYRTELLYSINGADWQSTAEYRYYATMQGAREYKREMEEPIVY